MHLSLDSSPHSPSKRGHEERVGNSTWHLAPDDLEELRLAIERSLCEGDFDGLGGAAVDRDLRKALRIACAKARLQRIRAESVLIDLKQLWMMMPGVLSTRTAARLSEIVTACIDEYYIRGDSTAT